MFAQSNSVATTIELNAVYLHLLRVTHVCVCLPVHACAFHECLWQVKWQFQFFFSPFFLHFFACCTLACFADVFFRYVLMHFTIEHWQHSTALDSRNCKYQWANACASTCICASRPTFRFWVQTTMIDANTFLKSNDFHQLHRFRCTTQPFSLVDVHTKLPWPMLRKWNNPKFKLYHTFAEVAAVFLLFAASKHLIYHLEVPYLYYDLILI